MFIAQSYVSVQQYHRAHETALVLPLTSFTPSPYLKLSGIATTLASVLELAKKPSEAYTTYASALHLLQSHAKELNDQERLRMVALASKLGEMAEEWQLGNEEEERWLVFAVEEGLRVARDVNLGRGIKINVADEKGKGKEVEEARQEEKIVLADLQLPGWLTAQDLGAPIEALGAFYARTGRVEYVVFNLCSHSARFSLNMPYLAMPPPSTYKLYRYSYRHHNPEILVLRLTSAVVLSS